MRRSLHAAADQVEPNADGLDRIREKIRSGPVYTSAADPEPGATRARWGSGVLADLVRRLSGARGEHSAPRGHGAPLRRGRTPGRGAAPGHARPAQRWPANWREVMLRPALAIGVAVFAVAVVLAAVPPLRQAFVQVSTDVFAGSPSSTASSAGPGGTGQASGPSGVEGSASPGITSPSAVPCPSPSPSHTSGSAKPARRAPRGQPRRPSPPTSPSVTASPSTASPSESSDTASPGDTASTSASASPNDSATSAAPAASPTGSASPSDSVSAKASVSPQRQHVRPGNGEQPDSVGQLHQSGAYLGRVRYLVEEREHHDHAGLGQPVAHAGSQPRDANSVPGRQRGQPR